MHGLMFLPSSLKKGILFSVDGEVFVKSGLGPHSLFAGAVGCLGGGGKRAMGRM